MRAIRALIAIVVITQLPASLPGQAGDAFSAYRVRNVPPWALKALGAQFQTQYEWYDRVNPFYQRGDFDGDGKARSEEHTSELQSQSNLVCRLLLEKKKR